MAYSDYGAFVYLNGKRVEDNEDTIFRNDRMVHGLIDDGTFEVVCYKHGLPHIFYNRQSVLYYDENMDIYDFDPFSYELNGYKFYFHNDDKPYVVEMTTPSGDLWICEYDYWYGAGFD